jgi:hypothetical protein
VQQSRLSGNGFRLSPDKRRYRPCGFQVSGNSTCPELGVALGLRFSRFAGLVRLITSILTQTGKNAGVITIITKRPTTARIDSRNGLVNFVLG